MTRFDRDEVYYNGKVTSRQVDGLGEVFHLALRTYSEDGKQMECNGDYIHKEEAESLLAMWKNPEQRVMLRRAMMLSMVNEEPPALSLDSLNDLIESQGNCNLAAIMDNNPAEAVELFETGSVTLKLEDRNVVVSLKLEVE